MNGLEVVTQLRKTFDQDRVDTKLLPSYFRAINVMGNAQSAPIEGFSRASLLVRPSNSLLTSNVDHELVDIWVDDGTNGNIDSTVRTIRFSTAASVTDGLFYSPKRKTESTLASEKEKPAPLQAAFAKNFRSPSDESDARTSYSDESMGNEKQRIPIDVNFHIANSVRDEDVNMHQGPYLMPKTEPVTPPRVYGKENKKVNAQSQATGLKDMVCVVSLNRTSPRAFKPEPAENTEDTSPCTRKSEKRGASKFVQLLKRKSTIQRIAPIDSEKHSDEDTDSMREQNDRSRGNWLGNTVQPVKKLSLGRRERRNPHPEQPTQSSSEEQWQCTERDRKTLRMLFKRFSSDTEDETFGNKPVGEEVRHGVPDGAAFAKCFKRRSKNAAQGEKETEGSSHQQRNDVTHRARSSSLPLESDNWMSKLSERISRFLGMLVH